MSADRELLELAAKAAGMNVQRSRLDDPINRDFLMNGNSVRNEGQRSFPWNPLADDGDALRLAVELRICIEFFGVYKQPGHSGVCCTGILHGQPVVKTDYAKQGESVSAATRRAIVRAAAAIGESMASDAVAASTTGGLVTLHDFAAHSNGIVTLGQADSDGGDTD